CMVVYTLPTCDQSDDCSIVSIGIPMLTVLVCDVRLTTLNRHSPQSCTHLCCCH
ncbi:hypothetical protein JOB18_028533, partial [Solea senegalensis]